MFPSSRIQSQQVLLLNPILSIIIFSKKKQFVKLHIFTGPQIEWLRSIMGNIQPRDDSGEG